MKKVVFALMISVFSISSLGYCKGNTDPVDIEQFKMKTNWHLKKYWYNKSNSRKFTKLKLSLNLVDSIVDQPGIKVEEFQQVLVNHLTSYFEKAGMQFVEENEDAVLSLNVIKMYQGKQKLRVLAGEFGAGAAQLHINGYLQDKTEQATVIAAFKSYKYDTGSAGSRDLVRDVGPTLVKEMSERLSRNLSKQLRRSMKIR